MKYAIAVTNPIQGTKDGEWRYGVTVKDDKGNLLYSEHFPSETHAQRHAERLGTLIAAIAPED